MNTEVEIWEIDDLLMECEKIDLTPAYQRGPAWRPEKQELLLDSVFRQYDLPKIYFAKSGPSDRPRFEVIDGQQRVRAILDFANNKLAIPGDIVGRSHNGKVKYADLSDGEIQKFKSFSLTIAVIEGATPTYKRTLFERLQLGERLNPAELRNALSSSAPGDLRAIALNHKFFKLSGIRDLRYKREDYLTHIFAYAHFCRKNELKDIKAPSLRKFILEAKRGLDQGDMLAIDDVLNFFFEVTRFQQKVFRNKWSFVDSAIFCFNRHQQVSSFDAIAFGRGLLRIEEARKANYKRPETLLSHSCRTPHKKQLFDYINAYKVGSGLKDSLQARQIYLETIILP